MNNIIDFSEQSVQLQKKKDMELIERIVGKASESSWSLFRNDISTYPIQRQLELVEHVVYSNKSSLATLALINNHYERYGSLLGCPYISQTYEAYFTSLGNLTGPPFPEDFIQEYTHIVLFSEQKRFDFLGQYGLDTPLEILYKKMEQDGLDSLKFTNYSDVQLLIAFSFQLPKPEGLSMLNQMKRINLGFISYVEAINGYYLEHGTTEGFVAKSVNRAKFDALAEENGLPVPKGTIVHRQVNIMDIARAIALL